jgi:hypothetical protein
MPTVSQAPASSSRWNSRADAEASTGQRYLLHRCNQTVNHSDTRS